MASPMLHAGVGSATMNGTASSDDDTMVGQRTSGDERVLPVSVSRSCPMQRASMPGAVGACGACVTCCAFAAGPLAVGVLPGAGVTPQPPARQATGPAATPLYHPPRSA